MVAQSTSANSEGVDARDRTTIDPDPQRRIRRSWWRLAVGVGEASSSFGFRLAHRARVRFRRRCDDALNFAEKVGIGTFPFADNAVDRFDNVTRDALRRTEASIRFVTRALRERGTGAAALTSTPMNDAVDAVDGSPSTSSAA